MSAPKIPIETRFWSRVNKSQGQGPNGDCWEWSGHRMHEGYGTIWKDGTTARAHRVSWELHFGEIPENNGVLHQCDNPPCVRPDHLFLGTAEINNKDMASKGRSARGEKNKQAKVTESDVLRMRSLRDSGWKLRELSSEFGITETMVSYIVRKVWWSWL